MCEAVREVLAGGACPTTDSFYRLRAAGVLTGGAPKAAALRCHLYAQYLAEQLA